MSETIHVFDTAAELAKTLAADVAARLDAATKEYGTASIAVSGSSTPKLFFRRFPIMISTGATSA